MFFPISVSMVKQRLQLRFPAAVRLRASTAGNSRFHFLFDHVLDTEMTTFSLKMPQIEELIEEVRRKTYLYDCTSPDHADAQNRSLSSNSSATKL